MNPILVALDVESAAQAEALATQLRGTRRRLQDRQAAVYRRGPAFVRAMVERGDKVFLDLKFHDIPNTVAGAVAVGGCDRRLDGQRPRVGRPRDDGGCREGRQPKPQHRLGKPRPLVIAVTVLTSLDEAQLREVGVESPAARSRRRTLPAWRRTRASTASSPRLRRSPPSGRRAAPTSSIVTPGIRPQTAAPPRRRSGADDERGGRDRRRRVVPGDRPANHGGRRSGRRGRRDRRRACRRSARDGEPADADALFEARLSSVRRCARAARRAAAVVRLRHRGDRHQRQTPMLFARYRYDIPVVLMRRRRDRARTHRRRASSWRCLRGSADRRGRSRPAPASNR